MALATECFDREWRFLLETSETDYSLQWSEKERELLATTALGTETDGIFWAKAGKCFGPAAPAFDDADWPAVALPHDWSVACAPRPEDPVRNGFHRLGVGWYRKRFAVPAAWEGQRLALRFDGVFRDAAVFVNGTLVARNESGYIGFEAPLDEALAYGEENLVAVRVNATKKEGWFYEGAGIYRHAWLVRRPAVHVPWGGLFVSPEVDEAEGAAARVRVRTEVRNATAASATVRVAAALTDPDGAPAGEDAAETAVPPGETVCVEQTMTLPAPRRWSLEDPALYRARVRVTPKGAAAGEADEEECAFGVRSLRFDPDAGFFLNGRPVKLQGVCCHQDHAGVGAAIPDRLQVYRLERLREMGCNAYRCAHNPPAPEVLEACDRLGLLVMDEARIFGASAEALGQLRRLVRRDRNHPSVILWSLGNEEMALQLTPAGRRIMATMKRETRRLDTSRPVTIAVNGGWDRDTGVIEETEVHGINYLNLGDLAALRRARPDLPLVVSESVSNVCTRGEYADDVQRLYVTAYDTHVEPAGLTGGWPGWGRSAESSWRTVAERPELAGTFVWTGLDYRGEQTPYRDWPAVTSHFGVMDLCAFPKDTFYYYQAWWSGRPVLHLLPHWNWPGRDGEPLAVWCYTNLAEVELFLNGRRLGAQRVEPNGHLEWSVPYEPGELLARGVDADGKEHSATRRTTGAPAGLALCPDREGIAADGTDVAVVNLAVVDAEGLTVPTARDEIRFALSGPGRILGLGNGDPNSHEPDQPLHGGATRRAFNGLAQVLLQSTGPAGRLRLEASSPGLPPAALEVAAR